jgi:hypothetical protein
MEGTGLKFNESSRVCLIDLHECCERDASSRFQRDYENIHLLSVKYEFKTHRIVTDTGL